MTCRSGAGGGWGLHPRHDGRRGGRRDVIPAGRAVCDALFPSSALTKTPDATQNSPVTPRVRVPPCPTQRPSPVQGAHLGFVPLRLSLCAASLSGGRAGGDFIGKGSGWGKAQRRIRGRFWWAGDSGLSAAGSLRGRSGTAPGGGGAASEPRVGSPLCTQQTAVSAVMSQLGSGPLRPQPPPRGGRDARPSTRATNQLAAGALGAARSQPARREGSGAGRAGGAQPVTRCRGHSTRLRPGAAAAPRSGTRAHARAHAGPPVTPGR